MSSPKNSREKHAATTVPSPKSDFTNIPRDPLERLRRGFRLRMDAIGRFWIEDEIVQHPRIIKLLRQGLDLSKNGEAIVRVQDQWTYLEVQDCILRANHIEAKFSSESTYPVGYLLQLDDQRTVPLNEESLWAEPQSGLRCTAPGQHSNVQLNVRLNNHAQSELSEYLNEDPNTGEVFLSMYPSPVNITKQSQRHRRNFGSG